MPRRTVVRRPQARLALALTAAAFTSCAAPINFTDPGGPRYADCRMANAPVASPLAPSDWPRASRPVQGLRVVTFNIQYAKQIDRAIALLEWNPDLATADVLLLQEMDESGVERIARALGMGYVYYPASVAPATGRHFGPAILSRWPLSEDRKLVLPRLGRFRKSQRIAVAATIEVGGRAIRVYSVHLATPIELGPGGRRAQVLVVLADADGRYDRVIVGGDLNAKGLGKLFAARGYSWPTRDLGRTSRFADVDHVFLRGLSPRPDPGTRSSAGKIRDNFESSDHKPVWVTLALEPGEHAR